MERKMKRNYIITALLTGTVLLNAYNYNANAASAYQGYTMFASGSKAYLVDMDGKTVHTWTAGGTIRNQAYLLEDGSIMVGVTSCSGSHSGAYPSGRFQKISWDGTVTWDYKYCETSATPGYDIEPMPNGNILIPCDWNSGTGANGTIIEVKPSGSTEGTVVWKYVIPDSLGSSSSGGGMGGMGGGMGTYINSVSYNPDLDMILVDMQEPVRKLVVIDHSGTGSVKYTHSITSGRLHAAKWATKYYMGTKLAIPGADTAAMRINNLLVVANGLKKVVDVNMTTNTVAAQISFSFQTHEGSCQRLPNGNTFVTAGSGKTAYEIDDAGTTVATHSFSSSGAGSCLRAYIYGSEYPGLSNISSTSISKNMKKLNAISNVYSYSAGKINIVNQSNSKVDLKIVSVNGKTVYTASSFEKNAQFFVNNLIPGTYFVEVKHAAGILKTSLVKM